MNSAISFENVTKRFQNTVALNNVTFSIPRGEIFGLLGPNGAGKTTLMRILTGIFGPDEGKVKIYGDLARRLKQRIGYLPEERGLYPTMNVKDLLRYFASIKEVPKHEMESRIEKGIQRVHIEDHQDKKVEELSKGNQQRVQLLITLLHQPDILVLDEPFSGLDPIGIDQMKQALIDESKRGATVIISTHRMEDAEQLCRSIALINRGELIRSGQLDCIKKEEGQNELVIDYQGDINTIQHLPEIQLTAIEEHQLRITLNGESSIPNIIRQISGTLEVYNMKRTEPTLHDIFVQLLKREEKSR